MVTHEIAVLDAPSNLGLRPPEEDAVPGCYKLPWALRDRGLVPAIGAMDAGCVVPPRYRSRWVAGEGDRNADAIAGFSIALANRLETILEQRKFALVLGGDCSILIGNMLALKRRGRSGLVFLDAHSDFRHPQNAPEVGAAAGEDLAIVTGRGDSRLINLENHAASASNSPSTTLILIQRVIAPTGSSDVLSLHLGWRNAIHQIVQVEALPRGIFGINSLWGRVLTYKS